jgi:hypothetical protein
MNVSISNAYKIWFPYLFGIRLYGFATAALAVGAAASVASSVSKAKGESKARDAGKKNAEVNKKQVIKSYKLQLAALQEQKEQLNFQAFDQMTEAAREANLVSAKLSVAAGEAMVGGNSVQRVVNQPKVRAGFDMATIEHNRSFQVQQVTRDMQGLRSNAQSAINEGYAAIPAGSSTLATALEITGQLASTGASFGRMYATSQQIPSGTVKP